MKIPHYRMFATVFSHPEEDYLDRIQELMAALRDCCPVAAAAMEEFCIALPKLKLDEIRELHTRTFDVQAIATLDVGYTIFGDDYKRGALLANLNGEHRRAKNDCGSELSDHLTNMLRLLPLLEDEEFRAELVVEILAPAVRRMGSEFESKRVAQKDLLYRRHYRTVLDSDHEMRTIYSGVLIALFESLRADFTLVEAPQVEKCTAFLRGLSTEMTTDECFECNTQS